MFFFWSIIAIAFLFGDSMACLRFPSQVGWRLPGNCLATGVPGKAGREVGWEGGEGRSPACLSGRQGVGPCPCSPCLSAPCSSPGTVCLPAPGLQTQGTRPPNNQNNGGECPTIPLSAWVAGSSTVRWGRGIQAFSRFCPSVPVSKATIMGINGKPGRW